MTAPTKLAMSLLVAAGIVFVVVEGNNSFRPAVPRDMPRSAYFVKSGYDMNQNEYTGDWVACNTDPEDNTDACRVTDAHGSVIYQGGFLPISGNAALPADQLQIAATDADKMWVKGPAEESPVPVISLANGEILVPAADRFALSARWRNNPEEIERIQGQ